MIHRLKGKIAFEDILVALTLSSNFLSKANERNILTGHSVSFSRLCSERLSPKRAAGQQKTDCSHFAVLSFLLKKGKTEQTHIQAGRFEDPPREEESRGGSLVATELETDSPTFFVAISPAPLLALIFHNIFAHSHVTVTKSSPNKHESINVFHFCLFHF